MAQQVEPMDVDDISEFDNKENSLHHSNVPPHTEKGYEELDVSELNMKLRYSMTPVSSPLSKSYMANRSQSEDLNNTVQDNGNSKSLDSTVTESLKSKLLPLHALPTDTSVDGSRNSSVLRPKDGTVTLDSENNPNVTVTVTNDSDEIISFPSTSSSPAHTPEATTPVKEIPKPSGSPIMRGLKSVFSMFRPSQSPISLEHDSTVAQLGAEIVVPNDDVNSTTSADFDSRSQSMMASTPLAHKHDREMNLKRESLVFNDDLEKELMWKDETTILFSKEKIPIHKLFYPQSKHESPESQVTIDMRKESSTAYVGNKFNTTVEPMDISYNNSMLGDKTMTGNQANTENDECVFLDCETTVNESILLETTMEKDNTCETRKFKNYNMTEDVKNATIEADFQDSDVTRLNETNLSIKFAEIFQAGEDPNVNKTANIPLSTDVGSKITSLASPRPFSEKSQIAQLVASTALDVIKALSLPENTCEVRPVISIGINEKNDSVYVAENKTQDYLPKITQASQEVLIEVKEEVVELAKESVDVIHPDTKFDTENSLDLPCNIIQLDIQEAIPVETSLDASVYEKCGQEEIGTIVTTTTGNGGGAANGIVPTVRYVAQNVPLPDDNENFDSIEFTETVDMLFAVGTGVKHEDVPPVIHENHGDITTREIFENILPIKISKDKSLQIVDSEATEIHATEDMVVDSINSVASQIEESLNQLNKTEILSGSSIVEVNESMNALDSVEPGTNLAASIEVMTVIDQTYNLNETVSSLDSNLLNKTQAMDAVKPTEISNNNSTDNECTVTSEKIEPVAEHHNDSGQTLNNMDLGNTKARESQTEEETDETSVDDSAVVIIQSKVCAEEQAVLPDVPTKSAKIEIHSLVSSENVKDEQTDIYSGQISKIPYTNPIIQLNLTTETTSTETTELPNFDSHETLNDIPVEIVDEDDELILSENNSPYVSLSAGTEEILSPKVMEPEANETENPFANKTKIKILPPLSPKLPGKGYNLNFDDIENPFASKTKIRLSPPPGEITEDKTIDIDITSASNPTNGSITLDYNTTHDLGDSVVKESSSSIDLNITPNRDLAIKDIFPVVKEVTDINITNKTDDNVDKTIVSNATSVDNDSKYKLNISTNKKKDQKEAVREVSDIPEQPKILPESSKIPVEGYDFNVDETNNLYVSETKIQISPSPGTKANQTFATLDKVGSRLAPVNIADSTIIIKKSQNTNINETFDYSASHDVAKTPVKVNNTFNINNTPKAEDLEMNMSTQLVVQDIVAEAKSKTHKQKNQTKTLDDIILEQIISTESNNVQIGLPETSSSEQSVYFSAGTSSGDSTSVLPVISVVNSFASKSKMSQSPPPETYKENPFATKSKIASSPERFLQTTETVSPIQVDHDVKELYLDYKTFDKSKLETKSNNESRDTCSDNSKSTEENDITAREVHTEDEDTMEGPLFEADLDGCGDNMPDIADGKLDLNQFNEFPAQCPEENVNEEAGEMFIDADAFEYLMNQNQCSMVSDSGKESLFLKFDPLFSKRVNSEGVVDALSKLKRRQSTPKKMKCSPVPKDLILMENSPVAGPSHISEDNNASEDIPDEFNVSVSQKPTMVVPPAVNPIVTPRKKVTTLRTPTRANRLSMSFTSSAMDVIDRLISLSVNNSPANTDTTIPHMTTEQNEADHALLQLRELLAEKELNVLHLRSETKELKDRLSVLESQMSDLETESDRRLKNINELNQKLTERINLNKKMASVVEEYERTISGLIAGLEEDKKRHTEERDELIKDRDEQSAHLASMEVAFSDLHSKYEKTKQLILSYKAREDTYKKSNVDFEENLIKTQNNYEQLKQHATSKLNHANQELEKINKAHEAEVLKMNAMIKRKDLHISSLEETLAQKTKANEELASICDELINKVG